MKKRIGFEIVRIGSKLWEKGGLYNKSQRYEDLTWYGKLGYELTCKGLTMMGITIEDLERKRA